MDEESLILHILEYVFLRAVLFRTDSEGVGEIILGGSHAKHEAAPIVLVRGIKPTLIITGICQVYAIV
jgi:hypothetical protein